MATQPNQPFPSIEEAPQMSGVFGPAYGVDSKSIGGGAVRNPSISSFARFAKAIVGTSAGSGIDFTDIQQAIDHVKDLGGGVVYITSGTYKPSTFLTLESNVHLLGEDPERTILDFTTAALSANESVLFAGGEEVTNEGAISTTNGSSTVSGGSSTFTDAGVKEDDVIYINAHPYIVKSVASNTSLTIKEVYRGINVSADIYAILRPKKNIFLENLILISNRSGTGIGGVLFTWCEKVGAMRVRVKNFSGFGFTAESCFNFTFMACEANNCLTGFEVHDEVSGDRVTNGTITNCYSWGNSSRGYNLDGVSIARLINSTANGNNLGIRIRGDEIVVSECHSEFNVLDGIRIDSSIYNRVIGNNCSSNANGITAINSNQNNTIVSNICELNTSDGINIDEGEGNTIVGNQCVANTGYGILVASDASLTRLSGNELAGNTSGRVSDSSADTVRDTRHVPIQPPVNVVNHDPTTTNWTALDCTAQTSANTYKVLFNTAVKSTTVGDNSYCRKNGSSEAQGLTTQLLRAQVANIAVYDDAVCETDTGQIFEWSVNNARVTAIVFTLKGYWEYID